MLSFGLSLILLGLSGGILPPAMMPLSLRPWMDWSPVTRMRSLMAFHGTEDALFLLTAAGVLLVPGMILYRHRSRKEVAGT
jgi:hypothetical protein